MTFKTFCGIFSKNNTHKISTSCNFRPRAIKNETPLSKHQFMT